MKKKNELVYKTKKEHMKSKNRKKARVLACILFSMFILAGCGNEKNSDRDSAKGKQETKEKTVSKENEKEENSEKDKEKNKVEKTKFKLKNLIYYFIIEGRLIVNAFKMFFKA